METDFLLLTHFSQRYPKIPVMAEENEDNQLSNSKKKKEVQYGLAFDLMTVKFQDLNRLFPLLPFFQLLFPEDKDKELLK